MHAIIVNNQIDFTQFYLEILIKTLFNINSKSKEANHYKLMHFPTYKEQQKCLFPIPQLDKLLRSLKLIIRTPFKPRILSQNINVIRPSNFTFIHIT